MSNIALFTADRMSSFVEDITGSIDNRTKASMESITLAEVHALSDYLLTEAALEK